MVDMLSSYIQGGFKIFKDNLVISYILVKVFQNNTYEMFTFLTINYYILQWGHLYGEVRQKGLGELFGQQG